MATKFYINGRLTGVPGTYVNIDATALGRPSLGTLGIVAVLGTAEGGSPYSGDTPIHSFSSAGAGYREFIDGDLKEAIPFALDPSRDTAIAGGAQVCKFVKVNPSTQAAIAIDSLTFTSVDYGVKQNLVNIEIAAGTNQGKSVTVRFRSVEEVYDDLGGDAIFTALYTPGSNGASTMTVALDSDSGVVAAWTIAQAGLDSQITAQPIGPSVLTIVSSSAGDTSQTITIYGLDAAGLKQSVTKTLNGVVDVVTTEVFSVIHGVILSAAAAGTVTVKDDDPVTLVSLAPAVTTRGVRVIANVAVSGSALSIVADGASSATLSVWGLNAVAASQGEKFTLNGAVPVAGVATWSSLTVLAVGAVAAARTVTLSGNAFDLSVDDYAYVDLVESYVSGLSGWTVVVTTNEGDTAIAEMDESAASTVIGSAKEFTADLQAIVDAVNGSEIVQVAVTGSDNDLPSNTSAPVYLVGGTEGAPIFANWQAALDLLLDEDVSTVVALTDDAAVQAAVVAHCVTAAEEGKERDCILGTASAAALAAAKTASIAANSRHARLCTQDVKRYNLAGETEWFPPYFTAVLAAGMQAGAAVGMPLTRKLINILDVRGNDSSYTVRDDKDELIDSGLLMIEKVAGTGFRWLRNVTTWQGDDNPAYSEASVNQAVNVLIQRVRSGVDAAVGTAGFSGTAKAVGAIVKPILAQAITDRIIVAWQNLTITLSGDTLTVDVEIAPVEPVNFVGLNIHLVPATQVFAA